MANWITRALSFPSGSAWTHSPETREGEVPISSLNDPGSSFYQSLVAVLNGAAGSGMPELPPINARSALGISAVFRAVRLISGTISGLPFVVTEERPDGTREVIRDPRDRVVWGRPNPEVPRSVFWRTVIAHNVLHGNSFIHVECDRLGRAAELWPINPVRVSIGRTSPDGEGKRTKVYVLDGDTERPLVDVSGGGSVIHVPGLTLDGLRGIGLIDAIRLGLQLARAQEEYGARVFAHGSLPNGYLAVKGDLTKEQADKLLAYWKARHRGLGKAGEPGVLDNDARWVETSLNLEQAQFLASRSFQVMEVSRASGVPPHLLFESKGATSWGTGLAEQTSAFVRFTLLDYSTPFEEAVSDALLRPIDRVARWNYARLLRGTPLQEAQRWQMLRNMGAMSVREIRREAELPELSDEELAELQAPLASNMGAGSGGDDDRMQALMDRIAALEAAAEEE